MINILKRIAFVVAGGLSIIVLWAVFSYFRYSEPDIQKILAQSELKNRNFNAEVTEIKTPSGLRAYYMEGKETPLVSISFKFIRTGLAYEKEKLGRVILLSDMLAVETKSMNAEKYAEFLQENGVKVGFSANYDDFSGQFTFPTDKKAEVVPVLKETLFAPVFSEQELELAKRRAVQAFAYQKEEESEIFAKAVREKLYADHPYGRNNIGNIEDVMSLKAQDLSDFMHKYFAKDNLIVSVAGKISKDEAATLIDELFANLPNISSANDISVAEHDFTAKQFEETKDFAQDKIMLVAKGVYRDDKDFYPLYFANYIFGGSGLNSRINQELRAKRGLTYGAYSGLSIKNKDALLTVSFATSPDNYEVAKEIILAEWKRFGEKGITKEEFATTQKYLIDSYNLRFDSTVGIASMLTEIQKHNLGIDFLQKRNDYVRNVSFEEVNVAAKKYFNNNVILIGLGKFKNE